MNLIITALDTKNYNHKEYYKIPIDPNGSFDYRHRTSLNAFFHSVKGRNRSPQGILYYSQYECDRLSTIENLKKSMERYNIPVEEIPELCIEVIDIPDVWTFYKMVGYDYKKRNGTNCLLCLISEHYLVK